MGRLMVETFSSSLTTFAWYIVMLFFALFFVQGVVSESFSLDDPTYGSEIRRRFGTLQDALLTLAMSITSGIVWEDSMRSMFAVGPLYGTLFIVYILLANFFLANACTGVFVELIQEARNKDCDEIMEDDLALKADLVGDMEALFAESALLLEDDEAPEQTAPQ